MSSRIGRAKSTFDVNATWSELFRCGNGKIIEYRNGWVGIYDNETRLKENYGGEDQCVVMWNYTNVGPLDVGDIVYIAYHGNLMNVSGIVEKNHNDGTYTVRLSDGELRRYYRKELWWRLN